MLVQKLRADDLQSEGFFDGIVVYAQNKVAFPNDLKPVEC